MSEEILDIKEQQKHFILNGNLWNVMFKLSWPAVLAMVFYGFNTVLDAIFVGQFVGETAVAGVSLAYPLSQMSIAFGSLVGVGVGSVLSIALGAKDIATQKKLMGNANVLTIICTVVYMAIALLFSTQLVAMMGGTGEMLRLGDEYFRITTYGSIFWIYGLAFNMIVRAEGKMKTAAWMMAVGLVVNAISNCFFMIYLDMGVAGAAWGTNVGMFAYSAIGFIYFGKGHATFTPKIFSLRCDKKTLGDIVRLGMPSLIMSLMSLIQAVVVFNALVKFGTSADVAFYGVVYRIFQFVLTPTFGLMRALQPAIGINFGAKQYERVISAYKIFGCAAMMLTIPFWLVSLFAPDAILGLMLTEQPITGLEIEFFRVNMLILPIMSFIFMAMTLFPSINKAKPAAMIGMARQFVFYIPVMLILPQHMGVAGVYYGSLAIDTVIVVWTLFMVKKEFKLLRQKAIEN